MKTEIIAKTQAGKEVICWVEIDEKGEIKTQYPIDYAGDVNHIATFAIELTKSQIKNLLNIKCPFKTAKVRLENTQDWHDIKFESRKIKAEYEKNESQNFWEKCLKEDTILTLSCVEGRNEVFGLPEELKNKNSLLVTHIKNNAKSEKTLTAGELVAWIKTLEQQIANRNDVYKRKLMQKAKETGRPQRLKSVPVEYNSHRAHWSEDRYITYIREDGTEFTEEIKAEPDHY